MRVALCHTRATDVGGVERYVHALAVRLIEAGHEVHYFCNWWDETVDPRIRLHRVPYWGKQIKWLKVLCFDLLSRRAIEAEGPFDVVHGFSKTSRQDIYRDGSGCAADYHAHMLATHPSPWARLARRHSLAQAVIRRIEARRYTPGACKRIVAISRLVKEQILARYPLAPEQVEVIYNGVDLERFTPALAARARPEVRRELELPPEEPLLLFVGSDYRRKGLQTFLEALARLPRGAGVVIGRERRRAAAAYEREAERLGLGGRVRFLGVQKEVRRFFAAADALAFPTLFDAFGNVTLEAMASGLPTVVSSRAGSAEVVEDGASGAVLSDPQDPTELADALRPYLDPHLARAHGARARALAEDYSWDRHFDRIIVTLYGEVAGRPAAAPPPPAPSSISAQ